MKIFSPVLLASSISFLSLTNAGVVKAASATSNEVATHSNNKNIEEVVVQSATSADRTTPVTFVNLSGEQLLIANALQEPSFLLTKTPSISAYSDAASYQGYSYFRLRGMDQTRINMTLDGVPLNEPEDQGVYFSNYPGFLGAIERIQVQRGVGMSQHGTASYAGSVQLDSVDLRQDKYHQLGVGAGSFSTFTGEAETLFDIAPDTRGFFRISGVQSDGYKIRSGNDSYSVVGSAERDDDGGQWKLFAFSGSQRNELAWLGGSEENIQHDRRSNANGAEDDEFQQSLVYLSRLQHLGSSLQWTSTVYMNHLEGNYDFDLNNFLGFPSSDEMYNYAFNSDFFGGFSTLQFSSATTAFSAGVHINDYARQHVGSEKSAGQLYNNHGNKDSYSAFVKGSYTQQGWTLFADLEHRHTSFEYAGSVDIAPLEWTFFNPRAGVSFAMTDEMLVYYSLGKTGREPTRNDLFGGSDNLERDSSGQPALFIVAPESVVDHELGLRITQKNLQFSANVYYMDFDREITLNGFVGPNGLLLNQDVDSSIREGVEVSLMYRLNSWAKVLFDASKNKGEIQDQGEQFDPILSPESMANIALEFNSTHAVFGLETHYQGSAYLDFANTASIGGWTTLNAYMNVEYGRVTYRAQVNNLLDKDYYASGVMDINNEPSYFVGAPVNVFASVSITL